MRAPIEVVFFLVSLFYILNDGIFFTLFFFFYGKRNFFFLAFFLEVFWINGIMEAK